MGKKSSYEELETNTIKNKLAEKALWKSEGLLSDILNSIQDGISVLTTDLTISRVNDVMKQWYMKNLPLEGKKCYECYHNSDKPCDPCPTLRCIKSGQTEREIVRGLPGSTIEWIELFSYPIRDQQSGEVTGIVEFVRNITEHKKIEEILRKSEEMFRTLFFSAPLGIAIAGPEGRFIEINDSGCRMLGYSKEELREMSFLDITYPNDHSETQKLADKVWNGKSDFYQTEKRYLKKDGSPLWATTNASVIRDKSGKIQYWIGIMEDITLRKQAENALKESEEKYRLLVNNLPGIVYKGFKDWSVEFYDNQVEELIGYSMHHFNSKRKKWVDLIVKEDIESATQTFIKALKTNKSYVRNYRLAIRNGNIIWIQERGYIVCNKDGDIEYVSGVFYDITDRKKAEEEKEKLEEQLFQVQKMESIGTLAGGIAHDFNNILGIIIGNTELALEDISERERARFNLDEIRTAALRAKDVVIQLLSFARKTKLEQKAIKLIPVVKDSIKLLRATIPVNIDIRQNMTASSDIIFADPTQIHQIIINLCTNASHAMQETGGILGIEIDNVLFEKQSDAPHPDLSPGSYVKLTVSDTGQGVHPEVKDRIFDPYFTTKEVGKGTGMGLSLVHGIVKNYGGIISVESKVGKGTTFYIYLPVVEEEAVIETGTIEKLPKGNERILFVDDDKSMVYVVRYRLERLGYKVETKTNPIEALELFRANPDQFDLIITDMAMPQMTGDHLVEEILKIRPDTPTILCTGFSEKIDEKKAKEIGATEYIEKPIDKRDFAIKIRSVLDRKKANTKR